MEIEFIYLVHLFSEKMHQNPRMHAHPSDPGPLMTSETGPMIQEGRNPQYWTQAKKERQKIQTIKYFLFAYNLCIFVSNIYTIYSFA